MERARISELDALASRQSDDDPFYLIHAGWLTQWRVFVAQNGPKPGPITNHLLLTDSTANDGRAPASSLATASSTPLPNLKRGDDYRALHGLVWQELFKLYGGGPTILRPTSDIYVEARSTQTQPTATRHNENDQEGDDEEPTDEDDEAEEIEVDTPHATSKH